MRRRHLASVQRCVGHGHQMTGNRGREGRGHHRRERTQTVDILYFFTRFTVVLAGDPYHARVPSAHPRESEDAAGRQSSSVPSGQGARTTGASDQQELVQCTECPLRARRVFALVRFLPLSLLPRDEL